MSKRPAYTFRCPEPMRKSIEQIMSERNLDRTSVIKLALYHFCKTMKRRDMKKKDLYQIVQMMETNEPATFMSFEDFIGE